MGYLHSAKEAKIICGIAVLSMSLLTSAAALANDTSEAQPPDAAPFAAESNPKPTGQYGPAKKHRKAARVDSKKPDDNHGLEGKEGKAGAKQPDTDTDHPSIVGVSRRHTPKRSASVRRTDEPCERSPVEILRGSGETERVSLTQCNGHPSKKSIELLSVLLRPLSVAKPAHLTELSAQSNGNKPSSEELVPGIKAVDPGLPLRLQAIADHYRGRDISIVSGYRPASTGSYHQDAKAVDLHVEGIKNEELVAFCKSLPDTGCGYYPNSNFVHIDVRPTGTGHVYWIDASGPGETPRYVSSWPASKDESTAERVRPDGKASLDEHTHMDNLPSKKFGRGVGMAKRNDKQESSNAR